MYQWFVILISFSSILSANVQRLSPDELNARANQMIDHVKHSIALAEMNISKLPEEVVKIRGLTSLKIRHLLNHLCSMPNASYLEIGCWKGATLAAAVYDNSLQAIAIDNWSEFSENHRASAEEFNRNLGPYIKNGLLKFYEVDCFKVDKPKVFTQPINIYFYDGNHSVLSQWKAFTFFDSVLDDCFIAIVDDWNWEQVKVGTQRAFKDLNYTVLFERSLSTGSATDPDGWWNGLYVAVIRKK
jgi:hypothetical protein